MRITEARDGFIKIESSEAIAISSFLQIDDPAKRYIAQVARSDYMNGNHVTYAKLLFIYDGLFRNYDKTTPGKNAKITVFPYDIFNKSFDIVNPVIAGSFLQDETNILWIKPVLTKKCS